MACTPTTVTFTIATSPRGGTRPNRAWRATLALHERLLKRGLPVPRLVMGGTPTLPIHAELEIPGVECSPGTIVLHDDGYGSRYPDLKFTPAALLLTRVVSRPAAGRLCLDLGHKAVAADPAGPRAPARARRARPVVHSEEHLVIETAQAENDPDRNPFLAIPTHICPTVALHRRALRHRRRRAGRPVGNHRPRSRAGRLTRVVRLIFNDCPGRHHGTGCEIDTGHGVGMVARADERSAGDVGKAQAAGQAAQLVESAGGR